MILFPAIDLLGGQVVRLYQGDYDKKSVFGENPAAVAKGFEAAGAKHLHLVDLDGAKTGVQANFGAVAEIAACTGLFIELGGGIRGEAAVENCFAAGVGRVILGTAALQDKAFFTRMVQTHGGEKIAAGVDARDGKVAVDGWLATSATDSFAFCEELAALGVKYIIYTDIARDGTGHGVNAAAYEKLAEIEEVKFTASGGVSSLADIETLKAIGVYAAIMGRALYDGSVDLAVALAACGEA